MGHVIELESSPGLGRLYARALRPGSRRRSGSLPDIELQLGGISVDRDHLAAYDRVCGFVLGDRLPLTYPHVLAFPLQVRLMTDDEFPFALAGLVHIRNVITQRRGLDAGASLRLRVRAERLAAHPKGAQVDLVAEVAVADADDTAWVSRSTYLARGAPAPGTAATEGPPEVDLARLLTGPAATWRVAGDTGRRYARVSGDVNPIHLHPLSARLFGFPGAIAHGMWTKARSLAALEARLPDQLTADVTFHQPIPLPSTVRFAGHETSGQWDFGVLPAGEGRPHLTGTVRPA